MSAYVHIVVSRPDDDLSKGAETSRRLIHLSTKCVLLVIVKFYRYYEGKNTWSFIPIPHTPSNRGV
jgi:hypothetical protein